MLRHRMGWICALFLMILGICGVSGKSDEAKNDFLPEKSDYTKSKTAPAVFLDRNAQDGSRVGQTRIIRRRDQRRGILLVATLDGRMTAIDLAREDIMWEQRLGAHPLVRSAQSNGEEKDAKGIATEPENFVVVPGVDGSVFVRSVDARSGGYTLSRLPYVVHDLVRPRTTPLLMVNGRATRIVPSESGCMRAFDLVTGEMLAEDSVAGNVEPARRSVTPSSEDEEEEEEEEDDGFLREEEEEEDGEGKGLEHPILWVYRHDSTLGAYEGVGDGRRMMWNTSVSEVFTPSCTWNGVSSEEGELGDSSLLGERGLVFRASLDGRLVAWKGSVAEWSMDFRAPIDRMFLVELLDPESGRPPRTVEVPFEVLWSDSDGGVVTSHHHESNAFVSRLPGGQPFAIPQVQWIGSSDTRGDTARPRAGVARVSRSPVLDTEQCVSSDKVGSSQWSGDDDDDENCGESPSSSSSSSSSSPHDNLPAVIDSSISAAAQAALGAGGLEAQSRRSRWEETMLLDRDPLVDGGFATFGDMPPTPGVQSLVRRPATFDRNLLDSPPGVVGPAPAPENASHRRSEAPYSGQSMDFGAQITTVVLVGFTVLVTVPCALLIFDAARSYFGQSTDSFVVSPTNSSSNTANNINNASTDGSSGVDGGPTLSDVDSTALVRTETIDGIQYRFVTPMLGVSSVLLGTGSNGTAVFRGRFGQRDVAVKRILREYMPAADREVDLLINADNNPHVVRYFQKAEAGDFVYLALELCDGSLHEAVSKAGRRRAKAAAEQRARALRDSSKHSSGGGGAGGKVGGLSEAEGGLKQFAHLNEVALDMDLVRSVPMPVPSPSTRSFLRAILEGVAHLHAHRIVHRDLKPQNILLVRRRSRPKKTSDGLYIDRELHSLGEHWTPKISDMGLGKRLGEEASSFGRLSSALRRHGAGESSSIVAPGTIGWQAPEVLELSVRLHKGLGAPAAPVSGRRTRAVDVWSLGCVFYTVLDCGLHPYADAPHEREPAILDKEPRLERLERCPEAADLISRMLLRDPDARPTADECLEHPFFWDDDKRLSFMCELSDRLETDEDQDSALLAALERHTFDVCGPAWDRRVPAPLVADAVRKRRYDFSSLRDCLRFVRNRNGHYGEIPIEIRRGIIGGDYPHALVRFCAAPTRFPKLFITTYRVVCEWLAHEDRFAHFLGPRTAAACALTSSGRLSGSRGQRTPSTKKPQPPPSSSATPKKSTPKPQTSTPLPTTTPAPPTPTPPPEAPAHREWYCDPAKTWATAWTAAAMRAVEGRYTTIWQKEGHEPRTVSVVVANHVRSNATKYKGGANVDHPRYKGTLCNDWINNQGKFCSRGLRCDFAHGPLETLLQNVEPDPEQWTKSPAKVPKRKKTA